MKRFLTAAMIAGLALAPTACSDDAHHPGEGNSPGVAAAQSAEAPVDQTAQRIVENVNRMQTQLEGVRKAKHAAQRDELLGEHMQTMRENMMLGNAIMQGSGMGQVVGQGGMGMMEQCMKRMAGSHTGAPDMAARMEQIEKRMDMMQMMMGQIAGRSAPRAGEAVK